MCSDLLQYNPNWDRKYLNTLASAQYFIKILILVLYEPGIAYHYKSDAALEIAKNIGGLFHLGTVFKIIPAGVRNHLYDYIAKNRYKWYGKKEQCMIPSKELKSKFL